jgi:hypothetical protein
LRFSSECGPGNWDSGKLKLSPYATSSIGNLHFAVGARLCSIYGSYDTLYISAQYRPLSIAQNNDRNCAHFKILLVPNILVGSDQHIESSVLGGL